MGVFIMGKPKICCKPLATTQGATLFPVFIFLASLLTSPLVEAEETAIVFLPRVTTGIMHYEYEAGTKETLSEITDNLKFSKNLPFLGVGATMAFGKLFMDGYFQTTTTKNFNDNGTFAVAGSETDIVNVNYERNTELERQDFALSFGSTIIDNVSVFVGYKHGNTSYDWTDQERDQTGKNVGTAFKENHFIAKGPFIGAAYNWQIGGGGLGFNFAVAKLDGEITTNRNHQPGDSDSIQLVGRERKEQVTSEAVGFKLGINWNAPITERLSYGISLDGFRYKFDTKRGIFRDSLFSDDRAHEILNLESYEVEETVYSLNLLLRYRF